VLVVEGKSVFRKATTDIIGWLVASLSSIDLLLVLVWTLRPLSWFVDCSSNGMRPKTPISTLAGTYSFYWKRLILLIAAVSGDLSGAEMPSLALVTPNAFLVFPKLTG